MSSDRLDVEVLVLGGGMSGMTAAARCGQLGLRVIVVEKAPQTGGSAKLSEGFVWTAPNMEALLREDPQIDPGLGRVLVETFPRELEWLRSLGIEVQGGLTGVLGFGAGSQIDVHAYMERCEAIIESSRGFVVTDSEPIELLRKGDRVTGARVRTLDGDIDVEAKAVVLATGGFQASPDLRRRYLHPEADRLLLRANRFSAGDGLRLALEAGAALSDNMSGFYGCLVPHPLDRELTHADFTALAQYHSERGILVNREGSRFCDESLGDRVSAGDVLQQPGSISVLLADEDVRRRYVLQAFVPGMDQGLDKFELAKSMGARLAKAGTWEALAGEVSTWGVDGEAMLATVVAYNARARLGGPFDPPRVRHAMPLEAPPFYALEVQPAITMTYGGVRVDPRCRALTAAGDPIPGLYAIGFDSGGLYHRGYAGGLARAIVTGVLAVEDIASKWVAAAPPD